MFGLGKKIRVFCGQRVSAKQALHAPVRANGFVCRLFACRTSYEQWEERGNGERRNGIRRHCVAEATPCR